ncbi:SIR2 family NAD-dependent protein deacylase [Sphingobacterium faecale]|uniref:NAD-dependent protein deacylase n=1 Tax=Sphingobacterium faecale TaxID=2803775 RepID=A0ABS1R343_9SPHI|nr:NAD-dependent deacylase [Sphingobacterium faecale]MBL1409130.1 NAD-dependent deacylase [Sphingobacterium faecale]
MTKRSKIVVLTGAGISAESGLQTFRGNDGLWEGYRIEDVATPDAWRRNPEMVQRFYNERRKKCILAEPNPAHVALADLEQDADVWIVTQNIDDLHERAGSKNIIHLHGEIRKSQSSLDPTMVYPIIGDTIRMEETCEFGSPLRPHVVWFGETVPNMDKAIRLVKNADFLLVVGTSLQVYPAANLVYETSSECKIVVVDPNIPPLNIRSNAIQLFEEKASIALPDMVANFRKKHTFEK